MEYAQLVFLQDYLDQIKFAILQDYEATHGTKTVMAVLNELHYKICKKLIGEVKPKYKLKLSLAEKHALLHVRNEYAPSFASALHEKAIFKLLEQNKI